MTASASLPDRRLTPARPDLAAASLRGQVEAARYVDGVRRAVVLPAAPLRPEPRADAGIDTELLHGEVFVEFDRDPEGWSWGQAQTDGYVGWLPSDALGPEGPPEATHTVAAQRSFVFPGPSIKLPPTAALPFGARLAAIEVGNAFVRVEQGFLWAGHLRPVDHVDHDPVRVAEGFLGVPYLWGGKTSLGLDCSALVQTAWHACGWPAPRDSDMQERTLGEEIAPGEPLRRGDLVFWRGHVGLMRDGGTLIHANGWSMTVALEPFAAACRRIAASGGGEVTRIRRFAAPLACDAKR